MWLASGNTRFGYSLADNKAIAKAVENFLIFSLQLHSNSYLYLNISVDNGSKTAEANRENVTTNAEKRQFSVDIFVAT